MQDTYVRGNLNLRLGLGDLFVSIRRTTLQGNPKINSSPGAHAGSQRLCVPIGVSTAGGDLHGDYAEFVTSDALAVATCLI